MEEHTNESCLSQAEDEDMELREMQTEARPIEVITAEIWLFKQHAGAAILEIGRRLIEAKAQLSHGEWLPWLEEKVEFSDATANRFMRLAREYEDPSLVTDLGASKALVLLALPASERESFAAEKHKVNGEQKSVSEMSKRELETAIRERDAAKKEAENARQEMEGAAMKMAEAEDQADELRRKLEEQATRFQQEAEEAERDIQDLKEQLEALREAPQEVAVEKVVDQEAVAAAETAARADEERKLKAEIEKTEKAKEKAEQEKHKAEQELAALKVSQQETAAIAEREKQAMEEQVRTLQKKLAVASSSELTIFKVHFEQGQEAINKMAECIARMAEAGDAESADKLRRAMCAMLNAALEGVK